MIDYHDSKELQELANKNIELSKIYEGIKKDYALAKTHFDLKLAKAYQLSLIEHKIAYEKAILLMILTSEDENLYQKLITSEHHAKAVEKIMNANSEKLMLSMSLIKNQQKILGE